MRWRQYRRGDPVIFRVTKHSYRPGLELKILSPRHVVKPTSMQSISFGRWPRSSVMACCSCKRVGEKPIVSMPTIHSFATPRCGSV